MQKSQINLGQSNHIHNKYLGEKNVSLLFHQWNILNILNILNAGVLSITEQLSLPFELNIFTSMLRQCCDLVGDFKS